MINLTKNQIVDPPVKCWVRDEFDSWKEEMLYGINHDYTYAFRVRGGKTYKYCTLINPNKKDVKYVNHADIFKAIYQGAVIRVRHIKQKEHILVGVITLRGGVVNYWESNCNINAHQICFSYTGTDQDIWYDMEEKV